MPFLFQPSFTAGELAPSLYGRVDIAKYMIGARSMRNMIVHPHGGASNRAGTLFVDEVGDSSKKHRLIPFEFSVSQSYVLVFGDFTMRVIRDGGYVLDGGAPVEIVTPYGEGDLAALQYTQSADVMYFAHPDYPPQQLSRTSHVDWTFAEIGFLDGPYEKKYGTEDIELTPAARTGLGVTVGASASLFTADMVGAPLRIGYARGGVGSDEESIYWGYGTIASFISGTSVTVDIENPFTEEVILNPDFDGDIAGWSDKSTGDGAIQYDSGAGTLELSVVAPADEAVAEQQIPADIGAKYDIYVAKAGFKYNIRIGSTSGGDDVYKKTDITSSTFSDSFIASSTSASDTLYFQVYITGGTLDSTDFGTVSVVHALTATEHWRLGAWRQDTGYPQAVGFHEQRLVFAGSPGFPQTIWMSRIGDYTNFAFETPNIDDDAITYPVYSQKVNAIQWLTSLRELLMGTNGAEWLIKPGGSSETITPTSISIKAQSYRGSANLSPLVVGTNILHVLRGGHTIRDLSYTLEQDGYTGNDLSILSGHLFQYKTIVDWEYAQNPDSIIWCVMSDGTLNGMTYMREHEVWGWHRHDTDGAYESVCAIHGDDEDDVYLIVRRDINGETKRYIELLQPRIPNGDLDQCFFVDCGLSYIGTPTTTISGLDHLEGKTVSIFADGDIHPQTTVSGGSVTLDTAVSIAHIGLPYVSDLETLDIELTDNNGSAQSRKRCVPSLAIRFDRTRNCYAGRNESDLDEIRFRDYSHGEDSVSLFTGDKIIRLATDVQNNAYIFLRQADPVPMTILAIIPEVATYGR